MKKKVAALLITGIMAVAMTACGSSNSGTDNSGSTDGTAKQRAVPMQTVTGIIQETSQLYQEKMVLVQEGLS